MGRKRHISKCWHLAKCGEKLHVRKEASFVPTPAADVKGLDLARWVKNVNLNLKKSMNPTSPAKTLPLTDCDRWPASLLLWQRHVGENRRRERLAKQYLAWFWNVILWVRACKIFHIPTIKENTDLVRVVCEGDEKKKGSNGEDDAPHSTPFLVSW